MTISLAADPVVDEQRRAGLRRMRIVATSLLVLAAIIFLLTLGQPGFGITGQRIPQGRQGLFQRHSMLLLLLLQMGQVFVDGRQRLLLVELILIQQGLLLFQLAVAFFLCQALAAGRLQRRLAAIELGQALFQTGQFSPMLLASGRQCLRIGELHAQGLTVLLPVLGARMAFVFALLQLQRLLLALLDEDGLLGLEGFALSFQCLQLGLFQAQGLLGYRHIQRLVSGYRRMLMGTAQRAGLMGLQLRAVDLQRLDALLLFQELFLVEHLLGQVFVLLAQSTQRLLVARQLPVLRLQLRL